jgi:hypothetical protein
MALHPEGLLAGSTDFLEGKRRFSLGFRSRRFVPVADLKKSMFVPELNSKFRMQVEDGDALNVELIEVSDVGKGGEDQFVLLFQGPAEPVLPQGTCRFQQDRIGRFALFVVPVGRNEAGILYESIINRM